MKMLSILYLFCRVARESKNQEARLCLALIQRQERGKIRKPGDLAAIEDGF